MKLCPRLDKPTLRSGQIACDEFDRIKAEHTHVLVEVRVKCGVWWTAPASMNMRMMIPKKRLISGTTLSILRASSATAAV